MSKEPIRQSTVYGPVKSWRLGFSLGIDLLFVNSVCSFKCIYCQLGKINLHTIERQIFVPTARVMADLKAGDWPSADIITLSGSGEPTLAANLGEIIHEIKSFTHKPIAVLTNATTLNVPEVRQELHEADKVFCKLDAADEKTFKVLNRPAPGITLQSVVEGIKKFRAEYSGWLAIQTMLMALNYKEIDKLARLLDVIQPDEAQLNLPLRPVPREWAIEARANLTSTRQPSVHLKLIGQDEADDIEQRLRNLTKVRTVSAWNKKER